MKRFVLSLVTALSLMGAAQSFAVPVPVVERLNFRGSGQTVDSAYATFTGSATTKYSQAIPTRLLANPASHLGVSTIDGGTTVAGPDSAAMAVFRITPMAGSAVTVSADSMFFALQVSANGTDWLTWTPDSRIGSLVTTTTDVGVNKAFALVEVGTSNCFYHALRADINASAYPGGNISNLGVTAAGVTDAKGWLAFPLIRVVLMARASAGQYQLTMRYYKEAPGIIVPKDDRIAFRHQSSSFIQGYTDSMFATSNGATGAAFTGAALDTTVALPADQWCIPALAGNGQSADSIAYASLIVTTSTDGGTTPANFDSVHVTPQISFDAATWISLPVRMGLETVGADACVFPLKASMVGTGQAWPNGTFVPIFSGGSVLLNRIYGLAPLVRFIIRRDVDYSGAIVAYMRTYKHVPE